MEQTNLSIQERFERFDEENPEVYREICGLADALLRSGRRHYSMDAILHVVRYHRHIRTTDKDFVINNNYSSRYARKIMKEHPELEGLFQLRELKSA